MTMMNMMIVSYGDDELMGGEHSYIFDCSERIERVLLLLLLLCKIYSRKALVYNISTPLFGCIFIDGMISSATYLIK